MAWPTRRGGSSSAGCDLEQRCRGSTYGQDIATCGVAGALIGGALSAPPSWVRTSWAGSRRGAEPRPGWGAAKRQQA